MLRALTRLRCGPDSQSTALEKLLIVAPYNIIRSVANKGNYRGRWRASNGGKAFPSSRSVLSVRFLLCSLSLLPSHADNALGSGSMNTRNQHRVGCSGDGLNFFENHSTDPRKPPGCRGCMSRSAS